MRPIIGIMLALAGIPAALMSQPVTQFRVQVNPELMQRPVRFKVSEEGQDTSTRMAVIRSFALKPGELKAVVRTSSSLMTLNKSSLPVKQDVFSKAEVYMAPELYFAREEGTNRQITYRIVFVDSEPLRYIIDSNFFEGSIRFLPLEEGNIPGSQPAQIALSTSESIVVSYGSTFIPLNITNVNWPPMDVPIKAREPMDSVMIKILTISNPIGYPFVLPVEPAILLSSNRNVIQGLGVQTLPVHVALKGITHYRPIPATIETSLGTLDNAELTLSDDAPREVILRSESTGMINLKVINPNYRSNSISIKAVFPWLFWLLSMLGGLLGSIAKGLISKNKITAGTLILGSIFGLMAAVAYWGLGLKLIDISFTTRGINELMVLGIGLLAGYLGIMLVPGRE